MNEDSLQLGDGIKDFLIGKKILLPNIILQFDEKSLYVKIDNQEASIPYETGIKD